jgi:hypothetical protein
MSDLRERDDITCPKDGEHIHLDRFSVCKFSEQLYFIHCPRCNVFHEFVPVTGVPLNVSE